MGTNVRRQLDGNYQNYLRRVLTDGGTYEQIPTVQFIDQYNKIIAYNPSMVVFPSSKKPGTLYTILPNSSSGDFTVTRASSGSYFDRNGIIRTAVANEPRLDYDPTTRQFNGVLVEPSATNLGTNSDTFVGAILDNSAGVIIQNVSASNPFNYTTVPKVIPTTGSGQHRPFFSINYPSNGRMYCIAKADGYNFLSMGFAGGVNNGGTIFDLQNGIVSTTSTGNPTIQNLGSGWYRCEINSDSGNASRFFIVRNQNNTTDYAGDGTSGILICHKQFEVGTVGTSPIITGATTASRAADVITRTGASSLIGQTEGSIYLEFLYISGITSNIEVFNIWNSVTNYLFRARINGSGTNVFSVAFNNNAAAVGLVTDFTLTLNSINKILITYNYATNTSKTFHNGISRGSLTPATPFPTNLQDKIGLGSWFGNMSNNVLYRNVALYTRALDDASAIELTRL